MHHITLSAVRSALTYANTLSAVVRNGRAMDVWIKNRVQRRYALAMD